MSAMAVHHGWLRPLGPLRLRTCSPPCHVATSVFEVQSLGAESVLPPRCGRRRATLFFVGPCNPLRAGGCAEKHCRHSRPLAGNDLRQNRPLRHAMLRAEFRLPLAMWRLARDATTTCADGVAAASESMGVCNVSGESYWLVVVAAASESMGVCNMDSSLTPLMPVAAASESMGVCNISISTTLSPSTSTKGSRS